MDLLASRIKIGDRQAFELFFRKYYIPLCGFINKFLNDPERSKELDNEDQNPGYSNNQA
jgi:hypothetical protein